MTVYQILEFFENQEQTEDFHLVESKNDKKNSSNNNNKSKNKRKSDSDDSSKYCMLHGKGSHSTDECKTLKSEAKRLKDGKSKGDSKNKTWKRKDDKKEINVAEATKKEVTKQVQAAMKELNVLQSKAKKRRIVDDDDESTEENNNVEMDPALFNYADIEEKLKISSDNEDEVTDELSV
jgi:hypothetical protein